MTRRSPFSSFLNYLDNKAASSNSPVSSVGSNGRIRSYRDGLALYGIIIAQAYLNLSSDLTRLYAGAPRDAKGNIAVKNIEYDDLFVLANAALALLRAVQNVKDKHLQRLYQAVMIKKLAWNSAKSGKVALALARLIPGF